VVLVADALVCDDVELESVVLCAVVLAEGVVLCEQAASSQLVHGQAN
jgi:hypothetical protein